mmetsp:Transcript_17838/g.23498  ORF Transcript_17838/g.23498 Transcript_17838/m.23498 type:complete len:516 (+) Transcript_17838:66-1613(+)|eukprot:CAMPEP_0117757126 /NCGR_PEP_ID=MMETSP0947-20121206/14527_1 /TAXON_ID=44440 /ORGANISM="Chattonella subsalsa, Strain CCMP2191" /LENGTH=515 /DNA_ID=CAMNT_0005576923 /DNA_START=46 /DNA_END=1593 /DNA_ORIENTATION=+
MAEPQAKRAKTIHQCKNFIGGQFADPIGAKYMDVMNPVDDAVIGQVALSSAVDVDAAVEKALEAFSSWSAMTAKSRAAIMFRFHQLIAEHADELADIVVKEGGKNKQEALASVAKGNETVEWACSMPQLMQGKCLEVSKGIQCRDAYDPVGVVGCIVPFNFPIMVPMWTVPIALVAGNCVILKPSEKVPMTMSRVAELMKEAGIPDGVFQMVNGTAETATALCDHPDISAITFVGSSPVAELVAKHCRALNKRVLALGGAKNHLVALPDCDKGMAAQDIMASFAGCAGQRCMAASVLLLVGDTGDLLDQLVSKTSALQPGVQPGQMGPVIDAVSKERVLKYINEAEQGGAKLLVDGRSWADKSPGTWVGPTIILHNSADEAAMKDEIFGPVLSVLQLSTWEEALEIENANPFGNAASIYTSIGAHADHFTSRFRAGMLGVNIGIPVPREPFSFGGLYGTKSKFGDMDITGDGAMNFFTNRRKVTTKWSYPTLSTIANKTEETNGDKDQANFAGQL